MTRESSHSANLMRRKSLHLVITSPIQTSVNSGEDLMRAVLQRVSRARVVIEGEMVGQIERGLLILLGIDRNDTIEDARWLGEKIAGLRAFNDAEGKMNLDVAEVGGSILVVSQFTLYGDCRKGRRPSFADAAPPETAIPLYEGF